MKKILITGSSGFIGQSLAKYLSKLDKIVCGTIRSDISFLPNTKIKYVSVGDISNKLNWKDILNDVDCIIHCAGKTHAMKAAANDLSKIYRSVNVDGTKQIAEQAAEAQVKRLIFLSSIKVNGESTKNYHFDKFLNDQKKSVFTHKDLANPKDFYAKSKLEAEKVLWEISSRTGLEVVVVRLPLVYGNGAKGNLARLVKLVKSGIPLPFSILNNQRSMIGIDNLVDLLKHCIDNPNASGKTFLASDDKDLSTPELIKRIASSMGRKPNLFPLPIFMLKFLGSIFGKSEEINRLVGSLRIDNSYTKEILNWKPPLSIEEGIRRMVQGK
jgi:nucleoside-diphosphate-sugar epimerase